MNRKLHIAICTLFLLLFTAAIPSQAAPGDLDTTFGTNGSVITQTAGGTNYVTATAIQPDGKIVAVGSTNGLFSIVRYNLNGSLDSTFNGSGISVSVVGISNALTIQPDGKIVVVGHNGDPANIEFKAARFNSNGTLDSTFDGDGVVVTPIGGGVDAAFSVAVQMDGKIVVSGRSDSNPVFVTTWAVVRYNSNGSLDNTFGNNGIVIPPSRGNAITDALVIQPDGKIVIAHNNYNGSAYILEVLRYNTNGSPDINFGSGGATLTTVGTNVEQVSVAIQTNGRIVAACSSFTGNSAGYDFWVVRYNGNGSLDTTFGGSGLVVTPVGSGSSFDVPRSVAIQANGKIVVGGKSQNGTNNNFALARYNPNGSLDSRWGTGGIVTTDLGGSAEAIYAVAIQLNGRIVAAGESDVASPGTRRFAVARYIGDTAADFDFDRDGAGDISVFRPSEGNWYFLSSANNSASGLHWGNSSDEPVSADFDGDLRTDYAVWRGGAFGYFYILNSSNNTFRIEQFGQTGDDPSIVGDYDGDGKADPAVYRSAAVGSQSYFYYRGSLNNPNNTVTFIAWGAAGDVAVRGDYSGDGRLDATVFRPSNGVWYSLNSAANVSTATQWGLPTDKLVPADYNGDGRTDFAVFRSGIWYILPSNSTAAQSFNWGNSTDKPVPADYDGDGRADVAVYRDGNWYIQQSTGGTRSVSFGLPTDIPTPTAYLP